MREAVARALLWMSKRVAKDADPSLTPADWQTVTTSFKSAANSLRCALNTIQAKKLSSAQAEIADDIALIEMSVTDIVMQADSVAVRFPEPTDQADGGRS